MKNNYSDLQNLEKGIGGENVWKLTREKDSVVFKTTIIDEELDPFDVSFDSEGLIEIDTSDMNAIALSDRILKKLLLLSKESKKRFILEEDEINALINEI